MLSRCHNSVFLGLFLSLPADASKIITASIPNTTAHWITAAGIIQVSKRTDLWLQFCSFHDCWSAEVAFVQPRSVCVQCRLQCKLLVFSLVCFFLFYAINLRVWGSGWNCDCCHCHWLLERDHTSCAKIRCFLPFFPFLKTTALWSCATWLHCGFF